MFLYLNEERDWRKREFKSSELLDLMLAHEADVVVEYTDGHFHVHKDRYGAGQQWVPVYFRGRSQL